MAICLNLRLASLGKSTTWAAITLLLGSGSLGCGDDDPKPPGNPPADSSFDAGPDMSTDADASQDGGLDEDAGDADATASDAQDGSDGNEAGADASCEGGDTVDSCGATCRACPLPEHGTAKCLDGECSVACEEGYIPSALRCVVPDLYVDGETGSDDNDGSAMRPFKTFHKGMLAASSGQTVHIVTNIFETMNGDDFSQPIPDGVKVQGGEVEQTALVARQDARGSKLIFAGSGELRNLMLASFLEIGATKGHQEVFNVWIWNPRGNLLAAGEANMRCTLCLIEAQEHPVNDSWLVLVKDRATLEFRQSEITPDRLFVEGGCDQYPIDGIRVRDSASIKLDGSRIMGGFSTGLYLDTNGTAQLTFAHIQRGCQDTALKAGISYQPTQLRLEISDSSFRGRVHILGGPESIRARHSSFYGSIGVFFEGGSNRTYDLGTAGNLGENTFADTPEGIPQLGGLGIQELSNIVVNASGNNWVPNQQGADANGRYAPGVVMQNGTSGRNITVSGASQVKL
jgi:hypothetical protein